jgi:AsmA protein
MRRRRIVIAAAGTLFLLVCVVLALPLIVDLNRYRGDIEAVLRKRLHRDVTLGTMRLSVVPPGLRVENALIAEDPDYKTGRPFAKLARIAVRPRILPLLRGAFELDSLELDAPEIELVRSTEGRWNVTTMGGEESRSPGDGTTLVLNRLVISGGQIAVTDLQPASGAARPAAPDARRAVYRNIDVRLDGFSPKRAFDVTLGLTPGEGSGRLTVRGKAGPLVRDALAATPFAGTATFDNVSAAGVLRFLDVAVLENSEATVSGSVSFRNEREVVSAEGGLQLKDARVHGVTIGYPIAARFNVSHDIQEEQLTIKEGTLNLDKTPVSLTGSVNLKPETPVLDVRVSSPDASLAETARLLSAFGVAFGARTRVQGRASLDVRAQGPARTPSLDGSLRLRDVSIEGDDIPSPVKTAAIDVTLTPAEIRSNEFTVTTAGTSVGGRATISAYTTPKPVVDARVHTNGADLGELLDVARAWGAGLDGVKGTGRATLDLRASGPFDALTYSGSASLANATVRTPDLAEPLRIGAANVSFTRDTAVLEKLAAGIGGTNLNGRLSIRTFASPRVEFQLTADRIDVREMQKLMPPGGEAAKTPSKKQQPGPTDTVFTRTTGTGRLHVGSILYDKVILDDVDAAVTLDRGMVRLNPLTAGLFGGRHVGSIEVDARRAPPTFSIASTLDKVDANRLTSAVTSLKDILYGSLGSTLRMRLSGDDAASMARSMNGTMSLALTDGRVANLNLKQEIANIARFITGSPPSERTTRVASLTGGFVIKDGLARTDDLTASIDIGKLGASGTIDLADQRVDLRLVAVMSKEASDKAGGSRIGGFMTTALANQQGELVIPLLVSGTMSSPRVTPDVQRFAEMRLKSLAPSLRDPRTLTSGILGAISGAQKSDPAAQKSDPAAQKDNTTQVGEAVLDLLRRRKSQEKPADPPTAPTK